MKEPRAILLYDGDCGLCLRSVRLLVQADRAGALVYAPQQGLTAAPILARHRLDPEAIQTVVLVENPDGPDEQLALAAPVQMGGDIRLNYQITSDEMLLWNRVEFSIQEDNGGKFTTVFSQAVVRASGYCGRL